MKLTPLLSSCLLAVVLLSGCASAQKFTLQTSAATQQRIRLVDQRPEASKLYRMEQASFGAPPVFHFGDNNFNPPPTVALESKMNRLLPAKMAGPVALLSLDLSLYRPKLAAYAAESGIGPGGVLLGKALFGQDYAGSARQEDSMTCSFEVLIAGKKHWVVNREEIEGGFAENMSQEWDRCFEGAVRKLAQEVAGQ